MSTSRKITITGAIVATLAAAGVAATSGVAFNDRRRTGTTRRQAQVAATLSDPSDARQRMLTMSDGAIVHVVERGPVGATPIVLLHGVTLSTRVWHQALDAMGEQFRVVALDWRGHGTSTAGRDGYGLEVLARDLSEVLEQLDLRGAVVVGHSMGGMALMRFCGNHPEVLKDRVAGLVFLSTAATDVVGATLAPFVRSLVQRVAQRPGVAALTSWTAPGDLGYCMVRFTFGARPAPVWVEQVRHIVSTMDPAATAASVVPLIRHDARGVLPTVTIPALVLVGSNDRVTPPSQARVIASLLTNAELVELDGPGHLIMLERQAQFHRLVTRLAERVQV